MSVLQISMSVFNTQSPALFNPSVSFLIGLPLYKSDLSTKTSPLWPGVFGLNFFNAMLSSY
jgi:hypothetical protein